MPTNLSPDEVARAQENFRELTRRDPQAVAGLRDMIDGGAKLGNDPRLIKHFVETSTAPSRQSLHAMVLYQDPK